MRISDWSSDVCSSDLKRHKGVEHHEANGSEDTPVAPGEDDVLERLDRDLPFHLADEEEAQGGTTHDHQSDREREKRSEEHTSELQSLMRNSYAVFCLKK